MDNPSGCGSQAGERKPVGRAGQKVQGEEATVDPLVLNPRRTRGSGDRGSSGLLRRTFSGTPGCLPRRSRSPRSSLAETRFSPSRVALVYSVSDEWVSVEMTYANKLSVTQRLDGAGELAAPGMDAATSGASYSTTGVVSGPRARSAATWSSTSYRAPDYHSISWRRARRLRRNDRL